MGKGIIFMYIIGVLYTVGGTIMKRIRSRNLMNIFPVILFIVSLFMSLGYATVNSILFDFSGEAMAKEVSGIFITNVDYKSNVNADMKKRVPRRARGSYRRYGYKVIQVSHTW